SSPSRRGPDSPKAIRSDARSPRFRPVPFVRDGVFDHDGVWVPRIAVPHILPSALGDGLGLRDFQNFRGSISHPTQLLCTLRGRRRRRATQHSLPGGRYPLPGPDLHRLDQISLSCRTPHFLDTPVPTPLAGFLFSLRCISGMQIALRAELLHIALNFHFSISSI